MNFYCTAGIPHDAFSAFPHACTQHPLFCSTICCESTPQRNSRDNWTEMGAEQRVICDAQTSSRPRSQA